MNKRELFLLFKTDLIPVNYENYKIISKHSFLNDEPPYIMVDYWRQVSDNEVSKLVDNPDDGESYKFYLIRNSDVKHFIALMNENQNEICDYHIEAVYTRNAGEHNLTPAQYVEGARIRKPKIKSINTLPNNLM